jgi:hypothetical protein
LVSRRIQSYSSSTLRSGVAVIYPYPNNSALCYCRYLKKVFLSRQLLHSWEYKDFLRFETSSIDFVELKVITNFVLLYFRISLLGFESQVRLNLLLDFSGFGIYNSISKVEVINLLPFLDFEYGLARSWNE